METRTLKNLSHYKLHADGRIFSSWFGGEPRELAGGLDRNGYRKAVLICDDGARRHVRIASLVCEAFHGPRPEGMVVRHLDGDKTNNAENNLAWGTQHENILDKIGHGTMAVGQHHGRTTVTNEVARLILESVGTAREVAARLGCSPSVVRNIRQGRTWNWLSGKPAPNRRNYGGAA